jgi:hypothetical protein
MNPVHCSSVHFRVETSNKQSVVPPNLQSVKRDHVQDYDHEDGKARRGVNLSKGQIQTRDIQSEGPYHDRHVPILSTDSVDILG